MKNTPESKRLGFRLAFPLSILVIASTWALAQDDDIDMYERNPPAADETGSSPEPRPDVPKGDMFGDEKNDGIPPLVPPKKDNGGLFRTDAIPLPAEEPGKTVRAVLDECSRKEGYSLHVLSEDTRTFLDGKEYQRKAESVANLAELCRKVLPDGYRGWPEEDGRFLYVGSDAEVTAKVTDHDVKRLSNNNERIKVNYTDWSVFSAVEDIRKKSHANILTQEMEPSDRIQWNKGGDNANDTMVDMDFMTNKLANCRRITYSTEGQDLEWRVVLASVLEPHYTFLEKDGRVRVMTKENKTKFEQDAKNAVRMEMRYVRVYHANPEDIVQKIKDMTGIGSAKDRKPSIFENAGASIQVAPYAEKGGSPVNSFRHSLSSSSSSLSTGNTKIGESGSRSSGNWGNLLRPKNPPAVILYDNPDNLDRLEALVKALDVREKQVLIEALILDLGDSGARQLGMKIDEMGFGNIPILGVSWTQSHESNHDSDNEGSWSGGRSGSTYQYRGTGRGTTAATAGSTSTVEGKDVFGNPTRTTTTVDSSSSGIAPSWPYGTVSEAFAGRKTGTETGYEKTSSSIRNRAWSTILGPLDFNFVLDLVQTDGDSKVLSSPVLTIGDHSEAMVHVGEVKPVAQLETTIVAGGVNNAVAENVEWYELVTGIMMWVGPEVTEDGGSVRLWVHPKLTVPTGDVTITVGGNTLSYPELSSQEIDTRVTVPSGGTLMLGGLIQTSKSEQIKRVPLLGDIPLLGRLFRWTSTSTSRRNLVIMVRPTVLDDETPSTGFEEPAMKIVEPMMKGSGRDLEDVEFNDENDPMKRRENAILEAVGLKKKDDSSETAEAVAEESDDTREATADAVEEPSVATETTDAADDAANSPVATDDLTAK